MRAGNSVYQMPQFFWQISIALILFTSSNAGYYADSSYLDFANQGVQRSFAEDSLANPLSVIGTISTIVCIVILFLRVPRKIPLPILIVLPTLTWLMISSLWSNTIVATLTLMLKTIIYINALDCALEKLDAQKAVGAFVWAIAAILLVSLALCITDPVFRISIGAEGWRGLFAHKNRLASFCLFSAPILLLGMRFGRTVSGSILALLIYMLVMSQGKAALGILLVASLVIVCFSLLWRGGRDVRPTLLVLSIAFWFIFLVSWSLIIYQINYADLTFSGRTGIWKWYIGDLDDLVLIGKGGLTASQDPTFVARAVKSNMPPTSDSSYVMILYNNGVIGLTIFFVTAVSFCVASIKNSPYFIYPLVAIFCYVAFAGMESDARFLNHYSTFSVFALYVIAKELMRKERLLSTVAIDARSEVPPVVHPA